MKRKFLALVIGAGLLLEATAYAHHSAAATYLMDKEVTIKGKVIEFMYANPHSFVKLEADDKGRKQTWAVEWGGVLQLSRAGVSRDSLRPGDRVRISGNPSRDPEARRIRMRRVSRLPDGWKWAGTETREEDDPAY